MGNPLPKTTRIGTIGELFVQLRLFEYGIQAAPPIKDSGNDLIAIKGEVVKFIQVKTSKHRIPSKEFPKICHLVALVRLKYSEDGGLLLDDSKIYIIEKGEDRSQKKEMTKELADQIWNSTDDRMI